MKKSKTTCANCVSFDNKTCGCVDRKRFKNNKDYIDFINSESIHCADFEVKKKEGLL